MPSQNILQMLLLFPDNEPLSWLVLYLMASFVLVMARFWVHNLLQRTLLATAKLKHNMGRYLFEHARNAQKRAQELATEYFLREQERDIEKEDSKLACRIDRHLSQFPSLQHEASSLTESLDKDFESAKVPVKSGNSAQLSWLQGELSTYTDKVGISSNEAKKVGKSIGKIEKRLTKDLSAHQSLFKKESKQRMKTLSKQNKPLLALKKSLHSMQKTVEEVNNSSKNIDKKIDAYYAYRDNDNLTLRSANQSILTRFAIALFFVLIAIGGSIFNFFLIERPLSEIVGGGGLIMGMEVAQMGAVMIIMLELATGVFFMEALGLSHLLPSVERWDNEMRKKVAIITGGLLLSLASVEAGLALLREELIAGDQATMQLLIGEGVASIDNSDSFTGMGPMLVQATIGFIIPLILAFVALPMEILFNVVRIIGQYIWAAILRCLGFLLRLLSQILRLVLNILIAAYDLIIFFWLFLERLGKRTYHLFKKEAHT
ncbi:MAG: hypothetical protein Q9M19_08715 [Mariprofundaceae bacterium]|nr:hypothetical protein [Mariprofundaceae bacterium]